MYEIVLDYSVLGCLFLTLTGLPPISIGAVRLIKQKARLLSVPGFLIVYSATKRIANTKPERRGLIKSAQAANDISGRAGLVRIFNPNQ